MIPVVDSRRHVPSFAHSSYCISYLSM